MTPEIAKILAVGLMCGIPFGLVAVGEGYVAAKAMEAMGRNPDAANALFPKMIVSLAIVESTAIYTLVVAFILLFAL